MEHTDEDYDNAFSLGQEAAAKSRSVATSMAPEDEELCEAFWEGYYDNI